MVQPGVFLYKMRTTTDIANRAMSLIGEPAILSIDDREDRSARACKAVVADVIDEVLRSNRWVCCCDRATLSEVFPVPAFGWLKNYQLPLNHILLLEVNGERVQGISANFVVEGRKILCNSSECKIRYVFRQEVPLMDPLLHEAIAHKLASEVSVPITGNVALRNSLEGSYVRTIGNASRMNAVELSGLEINTKTQAYETYRKMNSGSTSRNCRHH